MDFGVVLADRLDVSRGDITLFQGDAIINAANSSLMGGGGVDGAIHRRGGAGIAAECRRIRQRRYPEGLPTGEAVTTGGGALGVRYVIHTVAPIWRGGTSGERELLAVCYRNTLREALRLELNSIAYPAIGTGVYRFPKDEAARIAIECIAHHCSSARYPTRIRYVLFGPADEECFRRVVRRYL